MTKSIEEQKAAIAKIMGGGDNTPGKMKVPHYVFPFGKYKGETLESVFYKDRNYIAWMKNKTTLTFPEKVEDFIAEEI